MDDDETMMEDGPQTPHPMLAPAAVADPATAALTAGQEPEPEDAGTPESEQEDPYADEAMPGEPAEAQEETEPEEEPDTELPAPEEEPAARPAPVPVAEGAGEAPQAPSVSPQPGVRQEAAPAPDAARHAYWRRVLTGSASTVPDAVRQRAGIDVAGLTDEQRDYRLLSTINRSWAVDHLGVAREAVRSGWARLREQLAQRFHVADDEQELFTALSVEAQDAPRRERVKALYEAHCSAALLGKEAPAPEPLPVGEQEVPFIDELVEEAQRRGAELRRRYLPLARELAVGLDVFAGLEDEAISAPRVFSAVPEFARAVESLAGMDERSRQLVYAVAQAEFRKKHPKQDGSLLRTMMRSSRRGATGMGIGAAMAFTHATVASMNSLGSMLGENWGRSLKEGAAGTDLRARIVEETRRLLYDEVKPLQVSEEAGFAGQLMVDAAGAVPAAVAACCGGAGFAAVGISGVGEAVAAARQRAPEGSQWLQYLAGVVGGAIQASIYAGMSRVGGQVLSNAIGNFARSSGKGASGYTISSLGVLGAMGFEEAKLLFAGKSAEAAQLGTQELAARLEKTASNIDWRAYGDNAMDVELNLREAAMALPFILIASGRVALRHFRSRDAVLGDGHALQRWGIDEATRDAIMKERDINRQSDMLRDALRGSPRWSAPSFLLYVGRALKLLNTDYYHGFKDPKSVVDFMQLPAQGSLVPRPPFVKYSAENPEHVKLLEERHGRGEKVNAKRLGLALQLWDEWWQKAHIVPGSSEQSMNGPGGYLPTAARRKHFGLELMKLGGLMPCRVRMMGFYAPRAEAERMALLRDRVAEIQDLSYQVLLSSFPLDALSHSTRGIDHLRQASNKARISLLEAVGRSVLRQATGVPEQEALDELGKSVTDYYWRRRYTSFPPGWMTRVPQSYTKNLDEFARATFSQELTMAPPEFLDACRVALGFRACAAALYELLPMTPDFQTALARGLSPAQAYVHLLTRELGVDIAKARGVEEMLASQGRRATDMRAYRLRNEAAFNTYHSLTGIDFESARSEKDGAVLWRVRRPNGAYTHWHPRRSDAINDMMANSSFIFMPYSYDRMARLRILEPGNGYDLNAEGKATPWQFTGYDQLCRTALRDAARSWVESAAYAQPGFDLGMMRRYLYVGGPNPKSRVMLKEGEGDASQMVKVDAYGISSPLRLAQARFHTYWWRQLDSGLLSVDEAGQELIKLRIITPEELQRVKDIAKPLLMPRRRDVPLKLTPPPDVAGMKRAMAAHLTEFSMRYFLSHLDDMPLPGSAREWFRLAPICPLEPPVSIGREQRISVENENDWYTCQHNRMAARELRDAAPAVADLRRAEREGLLVGSPLLVGLRNAVGLNRAMNMEQVWCMYRSGAEAMMAAPQPFWYLMEKPLEGWNALDEATQQELRTHIGDICRTELSPEAMEAEARGETPDYLLYGLRNLQEVLQDYPNLHQYSLAGEEGLAQERYFMGGSRMGRSPQPLVRQLKLVDVPRYDKPNPFDEPEYWVVPLYTGGRLQEGASMGEPMGLPESLRGDSRIMPALHLLGALRSFPARRPHARREGIQWQGELYGGLKGRRLQGLDENWQPEEPLVDLIDFLKRIDELKASMPAGEKLTCCGIELQGLDGNLDLSPLVNVTLYRHRDNPSQLYRLMPGEPDFPVTAGRTPYVVQSIAGMTLGGNLPLRDSAEMHRSYVPLENFMPHSVRIKKEETREECSRRALQYTLGSLLYDSVFHPKNPDFGMSGMRELLMRFAEDSGFSRSLRGADPRMLSEGQVRVLQMARELLLGVCGSKPREALYRLNTLAKHAYHDREIGEQLLQTLFRSADALYHSGTPLFHPGASRAERRAKKAALRSKKQGSAAEDLRKLKEWSRQNKDKGYENDDEDDPFDGYNNNLRPDGFSRGFFDD